MSIFKVFTHKLKKCNNNVKIYDNFTKVVLFTIGIMFWK